MREKRFDAMVWAIINIVIASFFYFFIYKYSAIPNFIVSVAFFCGYIKYSYKIWVQNEMQKLYNHGPCFVWPGQDLRQDGTTLKCPVCGWKPEGKAGIKKPFMDRIREFGTK